MTQRVKGGLSWMLMGVFSMISLAATAQIVDLPTNPGAPDKIGLPTVWEREFLTKAGQSNTAEIKLAQLAEQRGSSEAVRDLGRRLVKDHTQIEKKMKGLSKDRRIAWPSEMDWKHEDAYKRLSNLSGAEFDRAWLQTMEEMHQKSIKKYQEAVDNSSDRQIKLFASQRMPILRSHLRKIRDVRA
jgi:putative membrane protein